MRLTRDGLAIDPQEGREDAVAPCLSTLDSEVVFSAPDRR